LTDLNPAAITSKVTISTRLATAKMGDKLELLSVMALLRKKTNDPWQMGAAIGTMMYHISPLLSTHLENDADFTNKTPAALSWTPDFVPVLDKYVALLRLTDGCTDKFPSDLEVDRKARKPRRKYMARCISMVEAAYKNHIRDALVDVFQSWTIEQTQLFNKGVNKALSGVQWVVYPGQNVVVYAGEGDWAVWLRGQCEELGMGEVRAGRNAFDAE
jgi:hypothetical protein